MKNDLKSSAISKIKEMAKVLETVDKDVIALTNYKASLENQILDYCEVYDIENEELQIISVIEVPSTQTIPLVDLFNVFPNANVKDIFDNVVGKIEIDLKETEENLRFSGDFQEPIIKNIIKQLDKLSNKTIKQIKLK